MKEISHECASTNIEVTSDWGKVALSSHIKPLLSSELPLVAGRNLLKFNDQVVRILASQASDVTDLIGHNGSLLAADSAAQSDTRVFMVSSPQFFNLSYAIGSGEVVAQAKIDAKERQPSAHKPRTADKIQVREIAQDCGGLKQPRWHAIENLVPDKGTTLEFCTISFTNLPIQDLIGPNPKTSAIIFEDKERGFELTGRDNKIIFKSNHPLVKDFSDSYPQGGSYEEAIAFLQLLSEGKYSVKHLSLQVGDLRSHQVVEFLTALDDGTWYFKSATGSLGYQVCKIKIDNHQITDITLPTIHQELFGNLVEKPIAETTVSEQLEYMASSRGQLGSAIKNPIIEAAIPREDIDGVIAEQRVIFNFHYTPQYLCSYSKVAESDNHLANRSQGGSAEPVRASFRRIIEARISATPEKIEALVEDTALRMKIVVSQFASDFIERANKYGFHYGPLFAVDVCPVWDNERQQIEFWLLEVQAGPGTVGAEGNIPPEEIAAVEKFNASFDDDVDNLC